MKKREFRNLRQGGRTVGQYVEDFSKLARYAPDDVAMDAAKQEKFLEGLNDELSMQLMVANFTFSPSVHPAVVNSLPILRSQSSATIGSVLLENTGGFSLRKRAKWSTGGGGGMLLLFCWFGTNICIN